MERGERGREGGGRPSPSPSLHTRLRFLRESALSAVFFAHTPHLSPPWARPRPGKREAAGSEAPWLLHQAGIGVCPRVCRGARAAGGGVGARRRRPHDRRGRPSPRSPASALAPPGRGVRDRDPPKRPAGAYTHALARSGEASAPPPPPVGAGPPARARGSAGGPLTEKIGAPPPPPPAHALTLFPLSLPPSRSLHVQGSVLGYRR